MDDFLNDFLDKTSDFLAARPGFLPMVGIGLIVLNLLLQFFPGPGSQLVDMNLFLHLGIIVSIIGLLLIRALG